MPIHAIDLVPVLDRTIHSSAGVLVFDSPAITPRVTRYRHALACLEEM